MVKWQWAMSFALLTGLGAFAGAHADERLNVLVITGGDPYGYHPWEANIERIDERLAVFGFADIDYHTARGLEDWRRPSGPRDWRTWEGDFNDYDAVVLIYYWSQAPEASLKELDRYLRNGGALVVAHSALAGFWEQELFDAWTGLAYREGDAGYGYSLTFDSAGEPVIREPGEGDGSGHAPIQPFQIHTRDPDHPVMRDIPATWMQAEDELYYNLRGPEPEIEVLAVAEWPEGVYHPQAWVRRHGRGRVFCLTPGHHQPGASSVGFTTLLARGIEWAATGEVTVDVPENFPGADEPVTDLPRMP